VNAYFFLFVCAFWNVHTMLFRWSTFDWLRSPTTKKNKSKIIFLYDFFLGSLLLPVRAIPHHALHSILPPPPALHSHSLPPRFDPSWRRPFFPICAATSMHRDVNQALDPLALALALQSAWSTATSIAGRTKPSGASIAGGGRGYCSWFGEVLLVLLAMSCKLATPLIRIMLWIQAGSKPLL